jgi:hypothetical protein
MTGPGYFMAILWLSYTILVLVTFSEPNRSGLEELRRREEDFQTMFSVDAEDDDDDSIDTALISMQESKKDESFLHSSQNCFKSITKAAALCMCIIFMKRVALESIVASTSVVTKNRYSWAIGNVGALHLVNGLIVIPVSIFSGWISQYYEDRFMALCLIVISVFGMSILVDVTDFTDTASTTSYNSDLFFSVGPARYVAGSLIAFSGIEACESFVASLMSKVVPSALAVGTFNSGLLITLVGTSGRATGDFFITFMGLISIRNILNLLVIPGMGLMIISGLLIRQNYSILAV